MPYIGQFKVNSNGEYKKLSELIDREFSDNTAYTLQALGVIEVLSSAEAPTSGGFLIQNNMIFYWTKPEGEDLWVKTQYDGSTITIGS